MAILVGDSSGAKPDCVFDAGEAGKAVTLALPTTIEIPLDVPRIVTPADSITVEVDLEENVARVVEHTRPRRS